MRIGLGVTNRTKVTHKSPIVPVLPWYAQSATYQYSPRLGFSESNGKVTTLLDAISGKNLTNNTLASSPTLITNALGDKSAVEFGNDQNNFLQSSSASVLGTAFFVFVINIKDSITSKVFFDNTSLNTYLFYSQNGYIAAFIDGNDYTGEAQGNISQNSWTIVSLLISPTVSKIWINGGTPTINYSGFRDLAGITLGARANGNDSSYCQIAESIIFSKELSLSEHNAIGLGLKSVYPTLNWSTPS